MKRPTEIVINGLVYVVVGTVWQNGAFQRLKLQLKRPKKPLN